MTEAEWEDCGDPVALLRQFNFSKDSIQGRFNPPGDRKLRLVACGCIRTVWGELIDERTRYAVGAAERFADGAITLADLLYAKSQARDVVNSRTEGTRTHRLADEAEQCCQESALYAAEYMNKNAPGVPLATQANVIRDIIGNPYRPFANPRVCHASVPGILAVARAAYEERLETGELDPVRLAVLADALEDGGITEGWCPKNYGEGAKGEPGSLPDWFIRERHHGCEVCGGTARIPNPLSTHLRSEGPHWRGCYVLDVVLGKETTP